MPALRRTHARGAGRALVAVYGILALAAIGRSSFQILTRFAEAPVAYTLSAVAAVVYVVATLALALGWTRIAWVAVVFELVGVLVVGSLSLAAPAALGLEGASPFGGQSTVWSVFGAGYLFVPLALPVLGIVWLRSVRRAGASAVAD